jgi:hypothetical protein
VSLLFVSIFVVVLLNTKMRENAKGRIFSMAVVNDAYAIFHGEDFSPP